MYELHTGPFTHTTLDVTARGVRPVRGSNDGIFVVEERTETEVYGLDPLGLVGYQVADGFMRRVPALELDPDGIVHVFGRDGISFLPIDPQPGQHWSDEVEVFDAPARPRRSRAGPREIENVGSVRVAAGTFEDVIVVRSEQWDRDWKEDEPLHSYEDYYARGVGLIRSVAHNHTRFLPIAELEQELTSVSFDEGGGRGRSEVGRQLLAADDRSAGRKRPSGMSTSSFTSSTFTFVWVWSMTSSSSSAPAM